MKSSWNVMHEKFCSLVKVQNNSNTTSYCVMDDISECWGWRKKWFCYAQTNSNVWFSWCLWDFVIAKQTKYVILNGQLSCIDMVQDSPWSNRVLQALLTWNSSTQLNSLSLLLGRGPRLRSRPSAPLSHTANGTDWPAYELRCCFPTVVSSLRVST